MGFDMVGLKPDRPPICTATTARWPERRSTRTAPTFTLLPPQAAGWVAVAAFEGDGEIAHVRIAQSRRQLLDGNRRLHQRAVRLRQTKFHHEGRNRLAVILIRCAANLALQGGVKSADANGVLSAVNRAFAVVRCTGG